MQTRTLALFSLSLVMTTAAMAADIPGTGTGTMSLGKVTLPAQISPEQRKQVETMLEQQREQVKKVKMTFEMKKDGKYTSSTIDPRGKKTSSTGTWTLKGTDFSLTNDRNPKQAVSGKLAAGGKVINLATNMNGAEVKIVLTKK